MAVFFTEVCLDDRFVINFCFGQAKCKKPGQNINFMKLIVHQNQINGHPEQFLRNAGYGFIVDRRLGKESFVRRLGRDHYPRLHMYVKREGEKIIFDIHLDQKQVSYAGAAHMHNAEHDGPVVAAEIERLKELVINGLNLK